MKSSAGVTCLPPSLPNSSRTCTLVILYIGVIIETRGTLSTQGEWMIILAC
jgi:hypothetical protein